MNTLDETGKPTIFVDLDGTLIKHHGSLQDQITKTPELLPGVKEKLDLWDRLEAKIIIITGRREPMRNITKQQLAELGIVYDDLIMGLGRGKRVIINDQKPNSQISTVDSYCMERNTGLIKCPF
jgi:hypothetical protein